MIFQSGVCLLRDVFPCLEPSDSRLKSRRRRLDGRIARRAQSPHFSLHLQLHPNALMVGWPHAERLDEIFARWIRASATVCNATFRTKDATVRHPRILSFIPQIIYAVALVGQRRPRQFLRRHVWVVCGEGEARMCQDIWIEGAVGIAETSLSEERRHGPGNNQAVMIIKVTRGLRPVFMRRFVEVAANNNGISRCFVFLGLLDKAADGIVTLRLDIALEHLFNGTGKGISRNELPS